LNKRIEITVDAKGNSIVETKGFTGTDCVEASKFIEQALGKQTTMQTTAEFFNVQTTQQQQASSGS
jgi:hypothetical protein